MGRPLRTAVGNIVYHVLNRANGRFKIFHKPKDYEAFEKILTEAKKKQPMRVLAYCLMPNHWHLVLYPYSDDELPHFMRWVTLTHAQRWYAHYQSIGQGHLYQGRYKSFPVQKDEHFLQLVRYVERNAKRAGLVQRAEDWRWSSLYKRMPGIPDEGQLQSTWPVAAATNYLTWVNEPQPKEEIERIRFHVQRGRPLGKETWMHSVAEKLGLQSTFRNRGRPWNKST